MNGFSERNVDYSTLWALLRAKDWKTANYETLLKLLEASGRIESMVASGYLSGNGIATLFQLSDTSARLKLLETLAVSERLVFEERQRAPLKKSSMLELPSTGRFTHAEVNALFKWLTISDRFELAEAIGISRRLAEKDKHVLHRILELAPFPNKTDLEPTGYVNRSQLFEVLVRGWKEQGWHLTRRDISFCPCRDLQTIDEFWMTHSAGRFGFSVQSQIWRVVEGDVEQFGQFVGWRSNNSWVDYERNIFAAKPAESGYSLNSAPYGHLPVFPLTGWWCWMGGMKKLIERLDCCNVLSTQSDTEDNSFMQSFEDRNLLPPASFGKLGYKHSSNGIASQNDGLDDLV
ncbi:GUN4 domain-containing protein [Thermocoleostomius sinensis]|uniref:GUN4 domain-containing protein n=1 Tax=Thermocoleostomius sinensis A174 TaxID=2016057 RepID=A0A9E9CAW1_9CYAN|nr:GUN4 domain-containing protein [Thermocoleostomius sinensis]WAL61517.1 GUN4 domain-containing protein [Thermocoleostomius sinensis A174]